MASLIGRDVEYAQLTAALESAGLILVSGDAGVGKSRLIRDAIGALSPHRQVVWGRPEQVTTPGPFALVIDILQYVMDAFPSSLSATEAGSTLEYVTNPRFGADIPVRRVAAQIRGLLSLLGDNPIVIIEDLHLCDEASLSVIAHLARSAIDDRYVILGAFRTEEVFGDERLDRFLESVTRERLVSEIQLSPLDSRASLELASQMLPVEASPATRRRIVDLGEGNPFFIEELSSAYTPDRTTLPLSVTRIVSARKQSLGAITEQVLKVATLMWGSIDTEVLTVACELDRSTVIRSINECVKAGLLEEREGRIVFRHALVREGIREELLNPEVEELSKRVASGIESVYKNDLSAHAFALAQHWYWARHRERALEWALSAGRRALGYASTPEAKSAFELAVACTDGVAPPEALLGLAEVGIRDGNTDTAEELFARAAQEFETAGRLDEAARALGRLAWMRTVAQSGDPLECIDRALELTKVAGGREFARLQAQKGQIEIHQRGQLQQGRTLLEDALRIAAQDRDFVVQAECLDSLAWEAEFGRRSSEADAKAKEASELAVQSANAETIGRTFNNRGLLLALHGKPVECVALLESARARLKESFGVSGLSVIDMTEAIARWRMGQPGIVAQLVAARENLWAHWRGYARMLDAWSAVHARDDRRARRIVESRWIELGIRTSSDRAAVLDARTFEAAVSDLIVATELAEPGKNMLAKSLVRVAQDRSADDHLLGCAVAARALLLAGEFDDSMVVLEELLAELSQYESPYFTGLAHELLGELHASDSSWSNHSKARENCALAVDQFSACENIVDRARCLRRLATIHAAVDKDVAKRIAWEAKDIATKGGSSLEADRCELLLRKLGVRLRVGRPKKSPEQAKKLSLREQEIAVLVASGSTNAEIGAHLFLSERTVQDHITHALRKIEASGRAGLAAWAVRQGLV